MITICSLVLRRGFSIRCAILVPMIMVTRSSKRIFSLSLCTGISWPAKGYTFSWSWVFIYIYIGIDGFVFCSHIRWWIYRTTQAFKPHIHISLKLEMGIKSTFIPTPHPVQRRPSTQKESILSWKHHQIFQNEWDCIWFA